MLVPLRKEKEKKKESFFPLGILCQTKVLKPAGTTFQVYNIRRMITGRRGTLYTLGV